MDQSSMEIFRANEINRHNMVTNPTCQEELNSGLQKTTSLWSLRGTKPGPRAPLSTQLGVLLNTPVVRRLPAGMFLIVKSFFLLGVVKLELHSN